MAQGAASPLGVFFLFSRARPEATTRESARERPPLPRPARRVGQRMPSAPLAGESPIGTPSAPLSERRLSMRTASGSANALCPTSVYGLGPSFGNRPPSGADCIRRAGQTAFAWGRPGSPRVWPAALPPSTPGSPPSLHPPLAHKADTTQAFNTLFLFSRRVAATSSRSCGGRRPATPSSATAPDRSPPTLQPS